MYMTLMPTVPHYGFRLHEPADTTTCRSLLLISHEEFDEIVEDLSGTILCEFLRDELLSGRPITGALAKRVLGAVSEIYRPSCDGVKFFELAVDPDCSEGFYRDLEWPCSTLKSPAAGEAVEEVVEEVVEQTANKADQDHQYILDFINARKKSYEENTEEKADALAQSIFNAFYDEYGIEWDGESFCIHGDEGVDFEWLRTSRGYKVYLGSVEVNSIEEARAALCSALKRIDGARAALRGPVTHYLFYTDNPVEQEICIQRGWEYVGNQMGIPTYRKPIEGM